MMTIFDIFTFFGMLVFMAVGRVVISYVLGAIIDNGKGDVEFTAWFTDIAITSVLAAGILLYLYKTGVITI